MTPDQFRTAMVMAGGDAQMQIKLIDMVQHQRDPIIMPFGDTTVLIDPQNPSQQWVLAMPPGCSIR